jgi:hypothetical protein
MVKTLPTVGTLMRDHPAVLAHRPFGRIVTRCALRSDVTAASPAQGCTEDARSAALGAATFRTSAQWALARPALADRQAATIRPVAARTLCSGAPTFVALAVFVIEPG